jgi:hypothetical protein
LLVSAKGQQRKKGCMTDVCVCVFARVFVNARAGGGGRLLLQSNAWLNMVVRLLINLNLGMADPDFKAIANRKLVTTNMTDDVGPDIILRWLNSELSSLAFEMLEAFGRALGVKYGALFVDGVISDLSEASLHMPSNPDSIAEWMHEWIGSLIVARVVLHGAFCLDDSRKSPTRRHRILESLAASICPLLVDSVLWNLPTSNARDTSSDGKLELSTQKTQTPLLLEGNVTVAVLLLDLLGEFSMLLGTGSEPTLSSVLYPVAARASQNTVEAVKGSAARTLAAIGTSLGFETVEDMIFAELTRLVAAMVGRLRLPGGTQVPGRVDADEILSVAASLRWTLTMAARSNDQADELAKQVARSGLVDLMSLLEYRLDHLFHQKVLVDGDIDDICVLRKAFFDYFLSSFAVNDEAAYSYKMRGLEREPKHPWLEAVSMFRETTPPEGLGTGAIHESEKTTWDDRQGSATKSLSIPATDIALFSNLIARNGYLLSNRKLKSRILACEGLTSGFKFLAFVGSEHQVGCERFKIGKLGR